MNEPDIFAIERKLATLPREVTPPRNLWPEIVARIDTAPRRSMPYGMVACVAGVAACMASIFTFAVMRQSLAPSAAMMADSRAQPFAEPRDPRYLLAKDELQKTFRERLALLEPKTRAQIEASLIVIRDAHEKIRNALMADPQSPALEELYQSTWHDEIDLYERVVRTTEPTMTRT